jgi:leucyl aminopeptidase (aminopeptidase T)
MTQRATPEDRSRLIIERLLAVKPGEQVAIVLDRSSELAMADALASAVEKVGAEYTFLTMPDRDTDRKNDLTPVIEAGLEAADVLIGMTRASGAPTYAAAVKRLYDSGTLRGMSMVMRSLANFTEGGALADYDRLKAEGDRLAALWRSASRIHLTTPVGTDLEAEIAGEHVIVECGFATEPGLEAAFSDGEVSQMPREGSARGRIVVDGPVAHLDGTDVYELEVSEGRVTRVSGDGPRAARLSRIIEDTEHADNIAEIGIGLNPACRRNGDFEEEKKARGLVHVALGDNIFYGGTTVCAVHMDQVLYRPSVWLDERKVVDGGSVTDFD